jgi:hypothetical protein
MHEAPFGEYTVADDLSGMFDLIILGVNDYITILDSTSADFAKIAVY